MTDTQTPPTTPPKRISDAHMTIPGRLNIALLLGSVGASAACLWWASRPDAPWWQMLAAAVVFSLTNNTTFSLLHEAVHRVAHPSRALNNWMGRLAAALFPTSFHLQRAFHLNHHRNNRTEVERFDYLQPGESRFLKYGQWYSVLSGVYWLSAPFASVLFFLIPGFFRLKLWHDNTNLAQQTSAATYFESVEAVPTATARAEILFSIAVQASLIWGLDLSWGGWWACYGAFALHWGSLQYADHAWSPLDRREGAWNLKVNPISRAFFLNYHDHLVHHRHPTVPWIHLPKLVSDADPRPAFWRIYLRMWLGPRPLPPAALTHDPITQDHPSP
jgi:fatty acid desaturase